MVNEYLLYYDKLLEVAKMRCRMTWSFTPEDVMQELYFDVLKVKTIVEKPLQYLSRMVANLVYDMRKKERGCEDNTIALTEEHDTPAPNILEASTAHKEYLAVEEGVTKLSKKRKLIIQYVMAGHTLRTIAALLSISWDVVRTHYYLATLELKKHIRRHYAT